MSSELSRIVGIAVLCTAVAAELPSSRSSQGGPATSSYRAEGQLQHALRSDEGSEDLNGRLFKIYGTGRSDIWTVAWNEFKDSPLPGSGCRFVRILVVRAAAEHPHRPRCPFALFGGSGRDRPRRLRHSGRGASCTADRGVLRQTLHQTRSVRHGGLRRVGRREHARLALGDDRAQRYRGPCGIHRVSRRREHQSRPCRRPPGGSCRLTLSSRSERVRGRESGREPGTLCRKRRSDTAELVEGARQRPPSEALLPWSFEPDIALGDAEAGLGNRRWGTARLPSGCGKAIRGTGQCGFDLRKSLRARSVGWRTAWSTSSIHSRSTCQASLPHPARDDPDASACKRLNMCAVPPPRRPRAGASTSSHGAR